MTTLELTDYLTNYHIYLHLIESYTREAQELDGLRHLLTALKGLGIEESPILPTMREIVQDLTRKIAILRDSRRLIEELCLLVDDNRLCLLLRLRYILGLPWEEVADEMHFELRYVHKLHAKAIRMMMENPAMAGIETEIGQLKQQLSDSFRGTAV